METEVAPVDAPPQDVAQQLLDFELDVLRALQSPSNQFLAHPDFDRLPELATLELPAPSLMDGAGLGLFVSRPVPPGSIVCLYPVHAIGREKHFDDGAAAFLSDDADGAYFDAVGDAPAYRQFLIGSRGLFALSEQETSSATPLVIDVNPNRERTRAGKARWSTTATCARMRARRRSCATARRPARARIACSCHWGLHH